MASTQESFSQAATKWDLERLYTDLACAKREVVPHRQLGLTAVEKTHLRGLLCGYRPAEIASRLNKQTKGVEVDLCNTLYRYVETLTDRSTNTVESWRDIVNWLEAAGYKTSEQQETVDWGEAPDISLGFYGREQELRTLRQWIVSDRCRLVVLLGMGGIGKTALSVRLTEQIQDQFEYVIWRSLRHAPPIEGILANLISFLSTQQETQADLSRLINYLRSSRCLVVLDEADPILRPGNPVGQYREGYEDYGELLRRVGEERHQSCLVLTSREKPKEIALREGKRQPVRSLPLSSLGAAAKEILREKDLSYEEEKWQILIKLYGGNPLALKIISTTIVDLFGGSVAKFLEHNTIVISDDFRQILEQHFVRLSDLEKKIMYELAIHYEPISLSQLTKNMSLKVSEITEALDSLGRRSLIEKATPTVIEKSKIVSEVLFTLQPVVMKYVRRIYPEGL
jgi:GTPase SAR1 family protein